MQGPDTRGATTHRSQAADRSTVVVDEVEAATVAEWRIAGQGDANIVLVYAGRDTKLVSQLILLDMLTFLLAFILFPIN